MKTAIIILPNALFEDNKLIKDNINAHIYIIEDDYYFTRYKFHKQKLILHRASMKYYYDYICDNNQRLFSEQHSCSDKYKHKKIFYIDNNKFNKSTYSNVINDYDEVLMYDPIDFRKIFLNKKITIYDSPSFMETRQDLYDYNDTIKNNKYIHANFYKWQRHRLNIFITEDNKPYYNKYSFDEENRHKFSKDYEEIKPKLINNEYIQEAREYVNKYFHDNFGDDNDFIYPINFIDAKKILRQFIKNKLNTFGTFQDAVDPNIVVGSHSILSSSINIGLITPKYIIDKVNKYFSKLSKSEQKHEYHNIEGFIRQIIGWRSYVRLIYLIHGQTILKMNNLNNDYIINKKWYNATTNIEPIDILINKVKKYAYLHHIERLMYIGNFALLTQVHPLEIYKWFMIVSIDSYEWVMVANVFGMSQYAINDNISMMTRPYFSSSNYILKMSTFKKGDWCNIWNSLYYLFIDKHKKMLSSSYAVANTVNLWNKKSENEKKEIKKTANNYLDYLHA